MFFKVVYQLNIVTKFCSLSVIYKNFLLKGLFNYDVDETFLK